MLAAAAAAAPAACWATVVGLALCATAVADSGWSAAVPVGLAADPGAQPTKGAAPVKPSRDSTSRRPENPSDLSVVVVHVLHLHRLRPNPSPNGPKPAAVLMGKSLPCTLCSSSFSQS